MCDSSVACPPGLAAKAFTRGPAVHSALYGGAPGASSRGTLRSTAPTGASEVARFSCRKFLGVHWGLRLRKTAPELAVSSGACCLPHKSKSVGVLIGVFRRSIPSPPIPLFTLRVAPHGAPRKTRGRADRYSLLVRLLPPLLPTGLSRRTDFHPLDSNKKFHRFIFGSSSSKLSQRDNNVGSVDLSKLRGCKKPNQGSGRRSRTC